MKGKHYVTIEEIEENSKQELLAILKRGFDKLLIPDLRIGKNTGINVLL